jgi:two-component system LytT family response regulator
MINIVIVDDSSTSRVTLEKTLNVNFRDKFHVVALCESVDIAIIAIKKFKPELVFLDIEMPDKNGFDLLKEIELINFEFIFTTSHPEYAIKALQAEALDYLIKPVNTNDLILAIERFEIKLSKKPTLNNIIQPEQDSMPNGNEVLKKIALPTENGYEFLKINSIIYCEASSNYCRIICVDGKEILLAKTLKNIQQLLPTDLFQRIHKSYLVNLNYIARFNRTNSLEIELQNGKKLPVSFRQKDNFLNVFKNKV